MQPQFLPETDLEAIAEFRLDGPVAIRALLRELIAKRALIALYASQDHHEFVVTQILDVGERHLDLDFITDDARRQAVLSGGGAIVIGFLDQIKIQFRVDAPAAVRVAGAPALRCPLPGVVYRIQRRDAYRVRPLRSEPALCYVRDGSGGEVALRVIDFSAGGLALALPPGSRLPAAGETWAHCRIEVGDRPPIPCNLVVRHVSETLLAEGGAHRAGCEYQHMAPETARALQMLVMNIEKRTARG